MHLSSSWMKILLILVLFAHVNVTFKIKWIKDLLNLPGKVVDTVKNVFDKPPPETKPTIPPPPVVVTKSVPVPETIFHLPSRIQTFFNPSDVEAKENYIVSPLSAGILMGELLIGTQDWYHNYLAKIMHFPSIAHNHKSREDEQIYHSFYHVKLSKHAKKLQTKKRHHVLKLYNAFFFRQIVQLSENFINKIQRLYEPEIVPVSSSDFSVDPIKQWSEKNMGISLENSTFRLVNPEAKSILVNNFVFNTTWNVPLKVWWRKEVFYYQPFENKKISYLMGDMENVTYAKTKTYTLVGIPLGHKNMQLYILLPEGSDFVIYNIRRFSESMDDIKEFKKVLKNAELRDVKLKLPNMFTQFVEFDYIKPCVNYINDENRFLHKPKTDVILLNSVAYQMELNSVVQYMYFSITDQVTDNDADVEDLKRAARFKRESKQEKVVFEVTRPFVFIIMDRDTDLVLVWGSISDPDKLK